MISIVMLLAVGVLILDYQAKLAWGAAAISNPVCIVGAGPSGLTIAHELEAKGIQTVLFDKQLTVGGKCQSFYDGPNNDVYHPMGALIFTNGTWANTLPLIEASGLPISPGPTPDQRLFYGVGSAAINVTSNPPITASERALLAAEFTNYTAQWNSEFSPLYTAIRYVNGVPEELSVSLAQWLQAKGFSALPPIMEVAMVPYGYGTITETPALYGLQYLNPDVLGVFLGVTPSYSVDFHKVMVDYSTSVKGTINLGATVTTIDRSQSVPVITYTYRGTTGQVQKCSKVVLAFPPTRENLRMAGLSLSAQERAVFSKVEVTAYWSSAVTSKIPFLQTFEQNPFQPLSAPVAFLRVSNESPIATAWSWGKTGTHTSLHNATEILAQTISDVHAGLGIEDPVVSTRDVKQMRKWDYFPHFDQDALKDGIYDKYNALQGDGNTFFSSGLDGFELVEFAIRAGKDLVARYF